jgi:hypothetical protein
VAFSVAGNLPRVDRVHVVVGRDQRPHPRAAVGLDADHDLVGLGILGQLRGDQRVELAQPGDPFRQSRPGQPPARLVQ